MRRAGNRSSPSRCRMADLLHASQERLRAVFRCLNRFMVMMWRLGLGRLVNIWPRGSGRMLVLGHTGRAGGLRRWTPLNYARVDGQLYCVSGFGDRLRHGRNLAISRISMSQLTVGVSPVPSIDHRPPRVDHRCFGLFSDPWSRSKRSRPANRPPRQGGAWSRGRRASACTVWASIRSAGSQHRRPRGHDLHFETWPGLH